MKFPANKILRRHLKTGEKKQNLATLRERLRKRSQQIGRLSKKSLRKQAAWIRRFKWSCLTAFFLITPIRDKQFFFFLKKVSIKAEKEDCFLYIYC